MHLEGLIEMELDKINIKDETHKRAQREARLNTLLGIGGATKFKDPFKR